MDDRGRRREKLLPSLVFYESTINSLHRLPESGIETNCVFVFSAAFKRAAGQRRKENGCDGKLPQRLFLKHFVWDEPPPPLTPTPPPNNPSLSTQQSNN